MSGVYQRMCMYAQARRIGRIADPSLSQAASPCPFPSRPLTRSRTACSASSMLTPLQSLPRAAPHTWFSSREGFREGKRRTGGRWQRTSACLRGSPGNLIVADSYRVSTPSRPQHSYVPGPRPAPGRHPVPSRSDTAQSLCRGRARMYLLPFPCSHCATATPHLHR
ncbi:hypothetical protein FIBSPDRAFT_537811 [Athelia psychrophila]|uniref:Uncharacterized protein n=1 Tax=Athelia psychrophila TaxID=1759441 RepID=A0A167TH10_9AGAM|nr:hypothetical protein FIBSPDRAFT_537811 [Fibularhizoctonia sp. CBS 109695]